MKRNKT